MKTNFSLMIVLMLIAMLAVLPAFATNSTLTVQTCLNSGITPSFAAAADTMYFANNGKTLIELKNTGAQITATIVSTVTNPPPGTAAANISVTVAATTGDKLIGPFNQAGYNNSTGLVTVIVSLKTGVTVAVYKLP